MATIISGNKLKLKDGKTVEAQQGGWYDGQQFWGGTLSGKGQINPLSNQQGAGEQVSAEVNRQSSIAQGKAPDAIQTYLYGAGAGRPAPVAGVGAPVQNAGAGGASAGMAGMSAPSTIDLPSIYSKLLKDAGIEEKEKQLIESEKNYLDAKNKMTNNPFLSASSMDRRLQRVNQQYEQETAPIRSEIATKRADAEMKLNLEMKQFDINSQAAQQAMQQFNTLLSMGALSGASGEDIASITRATGISSSMIQAAINKQQQDNVKTSISTFTDDAGNVTAVVLDSTTGAIISKQSLGGIGNAESGSGGGGMKPAELKSAMVGGLEAVKNSYGHVSPQDWQGALASWISRGGDADDFVKNFKQYADPNRDDFDQAYFSRD
jgi:hypothetical protein